MTSLVQVDVDNLWVYEREYGIEIGIDQDVIFSRALPAFLDACDRRGIRATFFVVGNDLATCSDARDFVREAVHRGHEVANHSFSHPGDLESLGDREMEREIRGTHDIIGETTGCPAIGFRGPGYRIGRRCVDLLARLGYVYDSSVLPGPMTSAMHVVHRLRRGRDGDARKRIGKRSDLIASTRIRPLLAGRLAPIEIPISVIPWLRLPFHTSMVHVFGESYQELAHRAHARTRKDYEVHLLHAVDLLPEVHAPEHARHVIGALGWDAERRARLVAATLDRAARDAPCGTGEFARAILASAR
jgi:peptidoglycan/xylan/chitin deacetylase (PgdA/CDA1 family)